MQCSFCGRTGADLRLFSAPAESGRRTSICAVCIKAFGEQADPGENEPVDLLEQMARRMRLGLKEPQFVRGLTEQYIAHARAHNRDAVVELARRWQALAGPAAFDDRAAEALRRDIAAGAENDDLCHQLRRPYETWLRMMRIGEG